jgi:hypothetical protein
MTSYTCVCQLDWLTYRFKVINSLMQDVWASSYKQTGWSWPPIFRTRRLQQRDHSFRYSLSFPSAAIMALCRNVLQEGDILCELFVDPCSDVSDYSDNESMDSDGDVSITSTHKRLLATGSLTLQFPHPFFLILWIGTVFNPFGWPGILVTTASKHKNQDGYSKFGPCMNILYINLGQYTA